MRKILGYLVLSRVLFLIFALVGVYLLPLDSGYIGKQIAPQAPYIAWVWANFDGRHFIHIASLGYRNFDYAYFPLYPAIISILGYVIHLPHLYLGITVSILSLLTAYVFVYKITRLDYDLETTTVTLFFLSIFPVSFFYHSAYTDSLFLLVSTASFYYARRGNWVTSGLFAGLATADRIAGITLLPALFIEWWLQNVKRPLHLNEVLPKFLSSGSKTLVLGMTGIGVYMFYLYFRFNDPFVFQKSMVAWKQSNIVFPPQVIFRYLKIFYFVDIHSLIFWVAVLEFVAFFLYLALAIYVWRKVRVSYGVFMVLLLSMVTFTGTFAGTPRYLLHLFPAFIGLALIVRNKPRTIYGLSILFLVLGFVLTSLFTRGYFVS